MESSNLFLVIYTENKPGADYAQRLDEKYKIVIKISKFICKFHYKGNVLIDP
jgi:hypothetical protein